MNWTPTKIVLEKTSSQIQLRVFAPETAKGSTVVEGTSFANDLGPKAATIERLRKIGTRYAKRWSIPFVDQTAEGLQRRGV